MLTKFLVVTDMAVGRYSYVMPPGGAGCLWAVLWFIMVSDEPHTHPRISVQEKEYIINSIGSEVLSDCL